MSVNKRPDISVIIVSFNTEQMTLECLHSLRNQTWNIDYEIIVVDNKSKDNSVKRIAREFPEVKLISLKKNMGFAVANNIAATEAKGRRLLLLNSDTLLRDNAVEKLYRFSMEFPDAGIWGGKTIYPDGTLNETCCYNKESLWSLLCKSIGIGKLLNNEIFSPETFGKWNYNTVRHVDIVTGCFFMICKQAWDALQGFNPLYFMYGEEVDLCLRAAKMGYSPMFTPEAVIIHYGGASEESGSTRIVKVYRAKATLLREHWKKAAWKVGVLLMQWHILVRVVVFALIDKLKSDKGLDKWLVLWQKRREWVNGY